MLSPANQLYVVYTSDVVVWPPYHVEVSKLCSRNTRFQQQYRLFWSQNRYDKKLPELQALDTIPENLLTENCRCHLHSQVVSQSANGFPVLVWINLGDIQ